MPIGRLASLVARRPAAALAVLTAVTVWSAVAVNALALQGGPHPAPLLGRADPALSDAALPRLRDAEHRREAEERRALVRDLQELLAARGFYDGEADGLAGPLTAQAIRDFEARAGLESTGEPRAALLAHIQLSDVEAPAADAASDGDRPAQAEEPAAEAEAHDPEETGLPDMSTLTESDIALAPPEPEAAPIDPQVEAVQRVLADLGYAPGRIDGQLGPQTEEAIRRFQRDRGMEPTGELDGELLRELSNVSGMSLG